MATTLQNIEDIIIVPQFHYDIAYLQTEEQYYPRCFENFRQAIALMDENPDYRYAIEQPFLIDVFEQRDPEGFERLKACHARGQLSITGALSLIPDMNIPSGESLIRNILRGKRYVSSRFGDDVRVAWIADTWGHSPALPQIVKHCGVDSYFFTRGMRPEVLKGDFLWVGIDGTTVVAHWLPAGYAAIRFPSDDAVENALELSMTDASEQALRDLAAKLRAFNAQDTVMLCNGGDMAPPQKSAPAMAAAWIRKGLPVRFGAVKGYADQLASVAPDLPRLDCDFNPLFVGAQGSRIRLKQLNRELENRLIGVESLHASLLMGGVAAPAPDLDRAWRLCLKNQFHDIISGTISDAAYDDALEDYGAALADVDFAQATLTGPGPIGGVFNPSAFTRTEWVETAERAGLVNVPPLAWAKLPAPAAEASETIIARDEHVVIQNDFWRLTTAPSGVVVSCVDVRTGREFVGPSGRGFADLVYRNDNGDCWLLDRSPLDGGRSDSQLIEHQRRDDPYRTGNEPLVNESAFCQHSGQAKRTYRGRAGERSVRSEGVIGFWRNVVEYQTTVALRDGDPIIRFTTYCYTKGRRYRLYACFDTPWTDARAKHSIPFGAIERDDNRYAVQNYVEAVGPNGDGVRVLNAGLPGNAVNDGVVSILLMRSAAMEYKAPSASAFEHEREFLFQYGVRPFAADEPGDAEQDGERINRPLIVSAVPANASAAPQISVAPDNVHVDAFYAAADGDIILRVHETAGKPAVGAIELAKPPAAVFESDGLETTGARIALKNGAIPIDLSPWRIQTWRIRL